MAAKSLKLVGLNPALSGAIPPPPRPLGHSGADLWCRIQSEYAIADSGGVELLLLACEATDRAAECAAAIQRDGLTIKTAKTGLRPHPCLKEETQLRALISRLIGKLGLDVEPVKPVGRPPGM